MSGILWIAGFLLLPLAAIVWFIVSLVRFLSAPAGSDLRRSRRAMLIASAIVSVCLIAIPVILIAMLYLSVIFFM